MNISTEEPKTLATIVAHMENDMKETKNGRRVWSSLPAEMVSEDGQHIVIGDDWGLQIASYNDGQWYLNSNTQPSLCESSMLLREHLMHGNTARLEFTRTPRIVVSLRYGRNYYEATASPEMPVRNFMERCHIRPADLLAMDGIERRHAWRSCRRK